MISHYFTFGQGHMTNFPLPHGGRIAYYWVRVDLYEKCPMTHREIFISQFTTYYCPCPMQWAMEYDEEPSEAYFPKGELCVVTIDGVQR